MAFDIVPTSFWRVPMRSIWDDEDDLTTMATSNNMSISEDEGHVYVEVAVPGIDPKDVEITFDKGILWVKGEAKEEEHEKKYYRKAVSSFSYRVAVPGEIDMSVEPSAEARHGMMMITFTKSKASLPKRIAVKP
jgi:HSP20 family protein